jgi:hypothetical protein
MILCKRIPEGAVTFNTADLLKKVKLVPLPRGLGFEQIQGLTKTISEKLPPGEKPPTLVEQFKSGPLAGLKLNTGELAVVRVMIKQKKMTPSEIAAEDKVNEMMSRKPKNFEEESPSKSDAQDDHSLETIEHGKP